MKKQSPVCGMCESADVEAQTYTDTFAHKETELQVDGLELYKCSQCGQETLVPEQIRRNQRRIADARRVADGLLTGDAIKELRRQLHLTQEQAVGIFGGGPNAFSKYERGDVIQSAAMDRLMRCAIALPGVLEFLAVTGGVKIQPRCINQEYTSSKSLPVNDDCHRLPKMQRAPRVVLADDWQDTGKAA